MESDSPVKKNSLDEKHGTLGDHFRGRQFSTTPDDEAHVLVAGDQHALHRKLQGRHMQFIAIGGAIGSGLFIGSASSFYQGGAASVVIGFFIIGVQVYLMMQQLAELAVMYPINGAFTMYICRFVDPSWGFACGWEYAISWLTVLPFEISAACNIIHYWPGSIGINDSAWIVPILFALFVIQVFGVRGYGEVEFVLSLMKVLACIGFIFLGIIINCGGVPTDHRGYIGGKYWHAPYKAFVNGFHGFCSVFVNAAFAYTGTELTGLAAAETADPVKQIPRASTQVIWRIMIFYVVNLLLVGLDVPYNTPLYQDPGAESRHSPFVIAIKLANIKALPSIFNAVILIAVISVANSCTFGSTRTVQALAANGMAPKVLAYVDKKGRPVSVIILQLLFGCLAFINLDTEGGGNIFGWLLALSGITTLFIYGSIGLSHIRFRMAWKANGHSVDEIPYRATFGIYGAYLNILISFVALMASFYIALYPIGGPYLNAQAWFEAFLAGPLLIFLYFVWKIWSWFKRPEDRPIWIAIKNIDIYSGMRDDQRNSISGPNVPEDQRRASIQHIAEDHKKQGAMDWIKTGVRNII